MIRLVIVIGDGDEGDVGNGDGGVDDHGDGGGKVDHTWAADNSPDCIVAEDSQAVVVCSVPDHHKSNNHG